MAQMTANEARCKILELADRYGSRLVLNEIVAQMSGDDAREFADWMERNKDNF